jgi:predicted O-methyltransferase YrrM
MPKGSLFVAHNVINKRSEMPDFLHTVETRPDLFTTIVAPAGEGVSVSWKR